MGDAGKAGVQVDEILVFPLHTPDKARGFCLGGNLPVLHCIGDLVGDDLPAQFPVQGDGIRKQHGKGLFLFPHMAKALVHQPLHETVAGIFRVGADAGDESDGVDGVVNIGVEGIDRDLRDKGLAVKAAQHIGALQNRELGLDDLVVVPAGVEQFLLRDLEGIAQQVVVLLQVIGGKAAYLVIESRMFFFNLHKFHFLFLRVIGLVQMV